MKALKKPLSMLLALLMCFGVFSGMGITAFAAGEEMTTYLVDLPRSADPQKTGWDHPALNLMGGWTVDESSHFTVHAQDSFNGRAVYCIEPGVGVHTGDKYQGRDESYPGNKLTGAEFEVYRDSNGNQELDEGDELLGLMEETSTGIYEMTHVEYGGVFVKESKAPDSFLLDENAYYVEITEQDKTYEVENEAGIGFVNMAQTGALRIEKTSSDGKLEGFAFRITGANGYDETFVTDENGEIHVELRVGDYTVSEVSNEASANYVLPADKTVTILADKTTVAEMHNELRDTPKTGDDSKPWLWAALMGVSAMGAVTLGVIGLKKRKKEDAE